MNNEKQNNRNGWADGFLSWEKNNALSDRDDMLWEKLNHRLHFTRKKKRLSLLWAAAALFVITGSYAFWNFQFNNNEKSSLGFKKHSFVLPNPPFSKTIETGITIINQRSKEGTIIKKSNNPLVANRTPLPDNNLIINTVTPVVTDSPQIAANNPVTQPKKIRIVHMNEWFSSPPPTFATSKEDNEIPFTPSIWPGKRRGLPPPSSNN